MDLVKFATYQDLYRKLRMKELAGMEDQIALVESFLQKMVMENDFVSFCGVKALEGIIASGSYRNMMELGTDKEMGGRKAREESVRMLFHQEPASMGDYPAYGMLVPKDKYSYLLQDSDPLYHYGTVLVTWKKPNLLSRTTMTVGNSLNWGESFFKCPTFTNRCSITCLHGTSYYQGVGNRIDTREAVASFAEKIRDGRLATNPASLPDAYDGENGYECYELQIHQSLSLSRDVEAVGYFPMGVDQDDGLFGKLSGKLVEMGIPSREIGS